MNGVAGNGNGSAGSPRPALIAWDAWLKQIGRTHTTGWRWRKAGWIHPVNIAGRLYVSDAAIAEFVRRAEAGEFSKEHKVPVRPALAQHREAA
jgi:hypothetical protein